MKAWVKNLIFILIILLLAGGIWLWQEASRRYGKVAVVLYGDNHQVELSLAENGVYDVDTGTYTVHLQVEDGKIRFIDSPCPDHLCEDFGWLEKSGDYAVCMPASTLCRIEDSK